MSFIKRHVAALEQRYADKPWFFRLYAAPYSGLVQRELRLARVSSEDVVLSIGCGALPFTAVLCARFTGARVIAVDIDPEAVRKARALIASLGMAEQVSVMVANAATDQLPQADVALVALQAAPKSGIRRNLQRSLPADGGRVVYRLPRHGLEWQYGFFDSFDEQRDSAGAVLHRMPTFDRSVLCIEQPAVAV